MEGQQRMDSLARSGSRVRRISLLQAAAPAAEPPDLKPRMSLGNPAAVAPVAGGGLVSTGCAFNDAAIEAHFAAHGIPVARALADEDEEAELEGCFVALGTDPDPPDLHFTVRFADLVKAADTVLGPGRYRSAVLKKAMQVMDPTNSGKVSWQAFRGLVSNLWDLGHAHDLYLLDASTTLVDVLRTYRRKMQLQYMIKGSDAYFKAVSKLLDHKSQASKSLTSTPHAPMPIMARMGPPLAHRVSTGGSGAVSGEQLPSILCGASSPARTKRASLTRPLFSGDHSPLSADEAATTAGARAARNVSFSGSPMAAAVPGAAAMFVAANGGESNGNDYQEGSGPILEEGDVQEIEVPGALVRLMRSTSRRAKGAVTSTPSLSEDDFTPRARRTSSAMGSAPDGDLSRLSVPQQPPVRAGGRARRVSGSLLLEEIRQTLEAHAKNADRWAGLPPSRPASKPGSRRTSGNATPTHPLEPQEHAAAGPGEGSHCMATEGGPAARRAVYRSADGSGGGGGGAAACNSSPQQLARILSRKASNLTSMGTQLPPILSAVSAAAALYAASPGSSAQPSPQRVGDLRSSFSAAGSCSTSWEDASPGAAAAAAAAASGPADGGGFSGPASPACGLPPRTPPSASAAPARPPLPALRPDVSQVGGKLARIFSRKDTLRSQA